MVKPASQRARHANQLHPHHIRRKAAAVAVAACFTTSVAMANPTAPTVVHGTATMSQAGGILNITNSHNAIINWGSFSIGVNELTRFIQPSALSAVLNRVVGSDPSAILGALQSNGRVFLINPNGIMFGSGAQINVAGLVASTLNISNDDFFNNRMRFTDGALAGGVVNQGSITGGSVYLIGNAVANKGLITSPNGEVVLAAGNSVELVNPGTPNLRVEVVAQANEARNLGTISAEAGRVGIYAGLIKQGGTISADSAVSEGGRIMLKSTKSTVLEAGSVTTARGTNGGEIIALSGMTDGKTEVAGKLDASAIASGTPGAGGFIDTSAATVKISDSAVINAAGSGGGKAGTWLIDPADFYISNAYGGNMSATFLSSTLNSYGGGTNVDIQSTSGSTGTTGTIFVNDAVTWGTDSTLRLIAVGNVDVNSAITNTGAGAVKLYAGWTEAFDGSSNPIVGTTAAPARNINLNAPISTLGDIHLVAHGNIVHGAPGSLTANGLQASSSSGFVNLANPSATNTVNTVSGRAIGQFAFKNTGNLTVGTVGGVSGITAYGGFPGLHVTVDVGVTGGSLTVANPIIAVGLGGSGGAAGGNANIALTASNGINVNSNLTATAGHGGSAYYGGTPGNGGLATISLTSTGVGSSVNINSSAGSVNANGGGGGDGFSPGIDGAPGGGGTINVTSAGGILVEAYVQANGGHGGSGSNASGGLAGNGAVNMSANGGDLTIGAYGGVAAYGGIGGYGINGNGRRGGDASLNLSASGGLTVTGTARALGGLGGAGSSGAGGRGGDALVNFTAGGALTIDSMQNFAVQAKGGRGGDGELNGNGGRGGDGSINLTSGAAMALGNSSVSYFDAVYATGGNGGYVDGGGFTGGAGGQAKVEVTSAGGITVYAGVGAQGGFGNAAFSGSSSASLLGRGGAATVLMTNNGSALFEQFSGNIYSEGGGGEQGGAALVTLTSAGGMTVNDVYADGGPGTAIPGRMARGGDAQITLLNTSTSVPLVAGWVQASGGEAYVSDGLADGGNASVIINSAGGIVTTNWIEASGGHGDRGGHGGTASVRLTDTSASGVLIDGAEVSARGGSGGSNGLGNGGAAEVIVTSAGGITVNSGIYAWAGRGGSDSSFYGSRGNGGEGKIVLNNTSPTAGIVLNSYAYLDAEGGEGATGGAATIDIVASGAIVINGSVDADGGDAYYGGNGGNAAVKLTSTGSSITISGSAEVEARGGDVNSFYSSGNGGQGIIEITSASNTSVSGFSSVVQAYGGDGGEGGIGGAAAVVISAGGGIFVSDSVVESYGGSAGSFGQGGAASVGLFASGPIQIEGGEGSNIRAYGGFGEIGGNAAINVISGGSILLSGSGMDARRGVGAFEGVASIVVAAAGNLTLQNEANLDSEGMVGLGGANILLDMGYAYGETGSQVDASGSLSVINNSFLGGSGIASITTGGNVLVETNGLITGYPDVMMNVGGEVFINTGGRIEAGLPTTIYLTFPMLESGGFTVNGVPGVLFDGSTGFFAGGGAILGTNLLVTYGGGAVAELNVPTDTLIMAMSESVKPPDAEKKKDIFEDENDAKKKKETASCR